MLAGIIGLPSREHPLTKVSGDAPLRKVQRELESIAPIIKRSTLDLWWVNEDGYSIIACSICL